MPQAEELEEAEIGEVAQAEVEAGRFEFPKRGNYRESGSHFARPETQSAACLALSENQSDVICSTITTVLLEG